MYFLLIISLSLSACVCVRECVSVCCFLCWNLCYCWTLKGTRGLPLQTHLFTFTLNLNDVQILSCTYFDQIHYYQNEPSNVVYVFEFGGSFLLTGSWLSARLLQWSAEVVHKVRVGYFTPLWEISLGQNEFDTTVEKSVPFKLGCIN